jgi:Flp pilus assembly protein TadD
MAKSGDAGPSRAAQRARALYYQGRYGQAEKELREAVRQNPSDAGAHYWLSLVLDYQDKDEEAGKALQRGLSLDPAYTRRNPLPE